MEVTNNRQELELSRMDEITLHNMQQSEMQLQVETMKLEEINNQNIRNQMDFELNNMNNFMNFMF